MGRVVGGHRPRPRDMLTLKWPDYPWQANVVRHVGTVALLKPTPVST
jgi:hypothetical protein